MLPSLLHFPIGSCLHRHVSFLNFFFPTTFLCNTVGLPSVYKIWDLVVDRMESSRLGRVLRSGTLQPASYKEII